MRKFDSRFAYRLAKENVVKYRRLQKRKSKASFTNHCACRLRRYTATRATASPRQSLTVIKLQAFPAATRFLKMHNVLNLFAVSLSFSVSLSLILSLSLSLSLMPCTSSRQPQPQPREQCLDYVVLRMYMRKRLVLTADLAEETQRTPTNLIATSFRSV